MKLLPLSLLLCLFPGTPFRSQEAHAAAPNERLHPDLLRVIAEHGPAKGWVFFRDKNLSGPGLRQAALEQARATLSPRALERRRARRVLPGLVDERDAALARPYVEAVLATGVELVVESTWLNAISVRGNAAQFQAIARLDCVQRVQAVRRGVLLEPLEPVQAGTPGAAAPAPGGSSQALGIDYGNAFDQLDQIGLVDLHARGYLGNGILIGILDTGFHRTHEAFNQPGHTLQVVAEHDFVSNDGSTEFDPADAAGQHHHGTWILGTIASWLPGSLVGGAPEASFVLCKTEDVANEYQQEEDFYVAGLQLIESSGADLATSSLGYIDWYTQSDLDGASAVTTVAVNAATDNGMPCITAAGNSGHDSAPGTSHLIAPADALQVITAGAVDAASVIAIFSSDGPSADGRTKPELLARGVSTWTVCADTSTNCLSQLSGTSLSTPLLASMVACLLQAHPDWTVGQLRARLFRTGDYFLANGQPDPEFVLGYGIPDADRAAFDCNGNGIDDALDIAQGTERDCNGNGYPDSCDLADGISVDANGNHIPDECPDHFRPSGLPGGAGSATVPLTVLPPGPRPGGRVRAALGPVPHAGLPFVRVRVDGQLLGWSVGPVAAAGQQVRLDQDLPDHPALLGLALELRGGVLDGNNGRLSWSRPLTIR